MCGSSDTAHLYTPWNPPPLDTTLAGTTSYSYTPSMPSRNTRVNLTLPDEVIDVLDRMGKATGAGRATIIREWLIEGLPQFAQLADAIDLAAQKNIDAFTVMAKTLNEAARGADQLALDMKATRRAAMRKRPK